MTPLLRPTSFVGALVLIVLLAGCTAPSPSPRTGTPPPDAPRDSATPTSIEAAISVAGVDVDGHNVTVSGFVQGILEDGGACTFSFTGPRGAKVEATVMGMADRSVTVCGGSQIARDRFTKGTWKVTLEYVTVDGAAYTSDPTEIPIP